jgi:glycosyltransferase involved in cell wall biosynthesis
MINFLITHYNRPKSLALCIDSIKALNLDLNFNIIVSDDCSKKSIIEEIKNLSIDKLILTEFNTGLSSNINRGLADCKGDYIIYVQEDFVIKKKFKLYIHSILKMIDESEADMVRLRSNVEFNTFKIVRNDFKQIPKFGFGNFLVDHYRYSDHPFVVKNNFFTNFGFYKNNVNTMYGENEYMVRMMKLNPKILIINETCALPIVIEGSVREDKNIGFKGLRNDKYSKLLKRFLNSLRFKIEYIFYDRQKRNLLTFKNLRENDDGYFKS